MDERPTFGSLFAGIGGLDLGLERAGWQCAWQVENNDFCQHVLAEHWPDVPRFGDIRAVGVADLSPVDLVVGGFPCQPYSVAGKRKGAADDRALWPEFARILRELRPRFALLENVPGLLSIDGGGQFGAVLGDLAALGYDAEWQVISAADAGAPHLRKRLFVVADATCARRAQRQRPEYSPPSLSATELSSQVMADTDCAPRRAERGAGEAILRSASIERPRRRSSGIGDNWAAEPDVGRVANGVPARVDRLRALGNAVVPQVAEAIGRALIAVA